MFQFFSIIWNKIYSPAPMVLAALVIIFKAPDYIQWMGYIFLVIGLHGLFEVMWPKALALFADFKLKLKIKNLPAGELEQLNHLRQEGWHDIKEADKESDTLYKALRLLEDKRLVACEKLSGDNGNNYKFTLADHIKNHLDSIAEAKTKNK